MSYLVFCTFDLKNASSQDYDNAYTDLHKLGLERIITAANANEVVIPTTSVMGEFDGESAAGVRDTMRDRIQATFKARRLKSELLVIVGGNWAWGAGST